MERKGWVLDLRGPMQNATIVSRGKSLIDVRILLTIQVRVVSAFLCLALISSVDAIAVVGIILTFVFDATGKARFKEIKVACTQCVFGTTRAYQNEWRYGDATAS